MSKTELPPKAAPLKPYSKSIRRGSLGSDLDGRTAEGKFVRRIEAELVEQIGGSPTFSQKLAIRRIARLSLQAELFDRKMATGDWTAHDSRTCSGITNALLRSLKDIGLKPKPPRQTTLADILAGHRAGEAKP